MAENEEDSSVTIPVQVGKGPKSAEILAYSRKSVLFVNNNGQFHMLPEDLAKSKHKIHRGNIIEKSNKDYVRGFKAAVGYDEKIGTKKIIQKSGVISAIEDSSRMDINTMVAQAVAESAKAMKEAGGK